MSGNSYIDSHFNKYTAWLEDYQPIARYDYTRENYELLSDKNPHTIWTKVSTVEADETLEKGLHDYGDQHGSNDIKRKFVWEWIVCEVPWGHDTESPLNISPVLSCQPCSEKEEPSENCENCKGYGGVIHYFEENAVAPNLEGISRETA